MSRRKYEKERRMIWFIPLALLIYGTCTYSRRSASVQFAIKLLWAILILLFLGNIYYLGRGG